MPPTVAGAALSATSANSQPGHPHSSAASVSTWDRAEGLGSFTVGWYERRVLPILLEKMMTGTETERLRKDALKPARGRVLEIGCGTGLNVPHYPAAVTHLVGLDPNAGMETIARRRL